MNMSRQELEAANELERKQLRRLVLLGLAFRDATRSYEDDRLNWEKVRDLESKERLFFAALDRWEQEGAA